MAKILVVDDETKILKMVSDYLEAVGFEVTGAADGISALKKFRENDFDLIVLDFMMPGIDGIDVIRRVREESAIPIIMLTARAEENDKLMGLEIGADDYIVKPFSMKELAARIRAVLRRSGSGGVLNTEKAAYIKYQGFEMDSVKRSLKKDGKSISLTMVQFELFKAMLQSPGRVFTRGDLLAVLQEASYESYERTIDVHIKNIRKAIENVPSEPVFILTVWGVGYKLAEDSDTQ